MLLSDDARTTGVTARPPEPEDLLAVLRQVLPGA